MKFSPLAKILTFLFIWVMICFSAIPNAAIAVNSCPDGMKFIAGGTFRMGDDRSGFLEEKSVDHVTVNDFCIDIHEVTNAEFTQFVEATGYVTVAERALSKDQFPNLLDEQRSPGSLVFIPPKEDEQVTYLSWWHWVPGANWRHPEGPESSLAGKENYPSARISIS